MNSHRNSVLYIAVITMIFALAGCGSRSASSRRVKLPEKELNLLDKAIKASNLYMSDKTAHIDSVKHEFELLVSTDYMQRWKFASRLAELYLPVRADSSLHYAEKAYHIAIQGNLPQEAAKSRIARINALSTAGIFARAVAEFDSISKNPMTPEMKLSYWSAGRKLYGYMRAYVEGDKEFFSQYSTKYFQYDDSLAMHLPASDKYRQFYEAEKLVSRGDYDRASKILNQLCETLPEESNLYGMAAFQIGILNQKQGNATEYASYLAKAAISDIKGCVKDGLALPTLAEWLYHEGELDDAFRYINFALEDAMSGNVRMRTVTIAALLPLIDDAYREKINASRDELMIYFLLVTFLLVLTVGLLIVLMRVVRRGRISALKLSRTTELQDTYIGHFVELCSGYANRLSTLQKLVTRKLAAGQTDELQQMIKNGKFTENDEFYKIFDSAFLDIYPDFIENINNLLRPEERVEPKKEKELSPEFRVYAFVRLGVEESTRIAHILNYSVSTVYAYRNRMRNRAIDRENFDRLVMLIGKEDKNAEI